MKLFLFFGVVICLYQHQAEAREIADECYRVVNHKAMYAGKEVRTKSGLLCQRWDLQFPHSHSNNKANRFLEKSLTAAENFCRDPDGTGIPWCYTVDPNVRRASCGVPVCEIYAEECYRVVNGKALYAGTVLRTESGLLCQRWDKQFPHRHSINIPSRFPDKSLAAAENFCRDPYSAGFPWCYTENPKVRWKRCAIPVCKTQSKDCYRVFNHTAVYAGTKQRTKSGLLCQRWDKQSPHRHGNNVHKRFPDKSLAAAQNFCRDPDKEGYPWCYTIDPKVRWKSCGVPVCKPRLKECYRFVNHTAIYAGTVLRTESGLVCQRWDKQYPHRHSNNKADRFPDKSLTAAENFCRDPDSSGYPWCYTVDKKVRWKSCEVLECKPRLNECYRVVNQKAVYAGSEQRTESGPLCQRWDMQVPHSHGNNKANRFPDKSLTAAENFCRDPDGEGYPWCYTVDPKYRWKSCGVPLCKKECFRVVNHKTVYAGTKQTTKSGLLCQRWDRQFPHKHSNNKAKRFPDKSLAAAENFCRDPDNEGLPWCYTLDPKVRWKSCGVPVCKPRLKECFRVVNHKAVYAGTKQTTKSGRLCQRWDKQSPHRHGNNKANRFPDKSLAAAENFCRDPDKEGFPWCYTVDPNIRWKICGVPVCKTDSKECFRVVNHTALYAGTELTANAGLLCQRWDRQYPHRHGNNKANRFPDKSLAAAENFCRDPDKEGFPWCYTVNPWVRWRMCGVPVCKNHSKECFRVVNHKTVYTGTKLTTKSGLLCQRWDRQYPHKHANNKANRFPDKSLVAAENFCRDPDKEGYPWCYTIDPRVRWRGCGVPVCKTDTKECFRVVNKKAVYTGTKQTTKLGLFCQRWDMQHPHRHGNNKANRFPDKSLAAAQNFCRDPDKEGNPWCYTIDPKVRWKSCGIPLCET